MVEQGAIAIGRVLQLLEKPRDQADVIAIDPGKRGDF
jgi:hypothetical protein